MKRNSAAIKLIARENLSGRYGTPMAALLLMVLCSLLPSMLIVNTMSTATVLGIVTTQLLNYMVSLLVAVVGAGYAKLMLNISRQEPFAVKDLFFAFSHHPDRFIIVHLILLVIQFVFALPFDLPNYLNKNMSDNGVLLLMLFGSLANMVANMILGLFFGLADYLLLDNTEMSAMEAMKESLRLMKGNKGRLLCMDLSFIPLMLLCVLSCYVGFLWLTPYMRAAGTVFYMDVTGELDAPRPEPAPQPNDSFSNPFGRY